MGKVKQAIEEVKEEIGTIVFDNGGEIELEEVKAILQNKYFFNDNSNPYLVNDHPAMRSASASSLTSAQPMRVPACPVSLESV